MPPLPDYFVTRPEHQQAVKDLLLTADNTTPGTLVVSAIYGLGGIGKSVLVAALAHDPDIQERFFDGILWATLGQEPDILSFLSGWIQALGDRDYKPTSVDAASMHLRSLLYDKQILLVVDDAWNPDHIEPFLCGGKACRILVTTREAEVPGAKRYDLEEMTPEQSLSLLTKKYPGCVTDLDRQQAKALAQSVGNLPLALELAAAQLTDGVTFAELLDDLQLEVARLEALDRPGAKLSNKRRKNLSLLASLNLSLQRLSPDQQRQFAWLGILPEDVLMANDVAAMIWDVSPKQAGTTLRFLRSRALLLAGARQPGHPFTYRLHDLMHDMAKRLLTSPSNADHEMPGLGLSLPEAHTIFLDSYRAKTQKGRWHTLPKDGYIQAHLTWHLEKAGRLEEIHQLLQEETIEGRNGWYLACESIGQTASFVTDVARAWQLAEALYKKSSATAIGLQCRYALIIASLNSLANNLPTNLIAALVEKGKWQPEQGLAYIQQIQDDKRRSEAIQSIVSHLPEWLLPKALKLARQIHDEYFQASALCALVPYNLELTAEILNLTQNIQVDKDHARILSALTPNVPELASKALGATRQVQDERERTEILIVLIPFLPGSLLSQALDLAQQDHSHCAKVLTYLIPYLPDSLLLDTLNIARQIPSEAGRAQALNALLPRIPELLVEVKETAQQIQDDYSRAYALTTLVPYFPKLASEALEIAQQIQSERDRPRALNALLLYIPSLVNEALEVTKQIQNHGYRVSALSLLVPHLPESLLPQALDIVRQIPESYRVAALGVVVPYLPEFLLPQALDIAWQLTSNHSRIHALSTLTPYLSDLLIPKALDLTRKIQDEYFQSLMLITLMPHLSELESETLNLIRQIYDENDCANALKALVPYLPECLLTKALDVARQIQDESCRTQALHGFMPRMPEIVPEVLNVTRQIEYEFSRADRLSVIVPYLPDSLLPEALEIAKQISSESDRVRALSSLVPRMPDLITEILALTREIQDESSRIRALCALVPHLPELASEVLDSIQKSPKKEYSPEYLLKNLIPHLPEFLWPQVIEFTWYIQNEFARSRALSVLAPYLPKAFLPQVVYLVQETVNESCRADVLSNLVPHLPTSLLPQALDQIRLMQSESNRAKALQGMAPRLTELSSNPSFWSEVLHLLSHLPRKNLLPTLAQLEPFILSLGGKEALPEMIQAMREVCRQWP